ncbi:hypothetical protein CPB83DRAFT_892119 [Crepidotus variabilis]|uniref:BTB domain-containing protein n=1 Tax=Crepidotus variabilis TaxID=179855 RepID=A0A9P6JRW3_9AGAR|nr:hypothetical protein CPB83DRAFT_892119 [Crepidotus variabilis]
MTEVQNASISTAVYSYKQNLKRSRDDDEVAVDEPPSKARQTHVKHETHWALDGNLLLQLGNVRFKVHRSRLCSQSKLIQAIIETSNGCPNKEYDTAEKLVENKEMVDGIDCFFFEDGPSAQQFAALLDCMDSAIEFVYKPLPGIETIKLILEAASYFTFERYEDFAIQYIKDLFHLKVEDVQENISPHAVDGIKLADDYPKLVCVLAPAFYELARQPYQENSPNGPAIGKGLSELNLHKLLHLQRKLSQAWDEIVPLLEVGGAKGPDCCAKRHVLSLQTFLDVKTQHPFDPILGIRQLKSIDWVAKKYCNPAIVSVKDNLRKKSRQIWADIPVWIQEVEDKPESNSNDSTNDVSSDDSESTTGDEKS